MQVNIQYKSIVLFSISVLVGIWHGGMQHIHFVEQASLDFSCSSSSLSIDIR